MKWLVIKDADGEGSWESVSLESIDVIQFDRSGTMYVFQRGYPPKGFRAPHISLDQEPYIGRVGSARA